MVYGNLGNSAKLSEANTKLSNKSHYSRITVSYTHLDSVMPWGNYNGMPPHTVPILDGIRKALGSDDRLIYDRCV